jgi:hypothetical protein
VQAGARRAAQRPPPCTVGGRLEQGGFRVAAATKLLVMWAAMEKQYGGGQRLGARPSAPASMSARPQFAYGFHLDEWDRSGLEGPPLLDVSATPVERVGSGTAMKDSLPPIHLRSEGGWCRLLHSKLASRGFARDCCFASPRLHMPYLATIPAYLHRKATHACHMPAVFWESLTPVMHHVATGSCAAADNCTLQSESLAPWAGPL